MLLKEIYEFLNQKFPFSKQLDFDNSGFLIGDKQAKIKGILICLDITSEVISEAKEKNCNLILSHHPIIFHPLKQLTADSIPFQLIKEEVNVIALHTNLDIAIGGVNDVFARTLGLKEITAICLEEETLGLVRIGKVQGVTAETFANQVKNALGCQAVKLNLLNKKVQTVAVCGGAGNDYIFDLVEKGIDIFVTSQVKHETFLFATQNNLAVIDAGHFETEVIVLPVLKALLQTGYKNLPVFVSESEKNPITII